MSGLLMKELLYLKKQGKTFLLMIAFYIVFFLLMGGNKNFADKLLSIIISVMIFLGLMLTINGFAYDEAAKWDGFVKSLPISTGTIVGAKYLLVAIFAAIGTVIAAAVDLIAANGHIQLDGLAAVCAGAGAPPLILCSILLPLFYKFGLQKARIAMMIVFIIPFAGVMLVKDAGFSVSAAQGMLLLKLSPVILLAVVFLSLYLSCRIYAHKEV